MMSARMAVRAEGRAQADVLVPGDLSGGQPSIEDLRSRYIRGPLPVMPAGTPILREPDDGENQAADYEVACDHEYRGAHAHVLMPERILCLHIWVAVHSRRYSREPTRLSAVSTVVLE